jgi:UDP-N-acetylglucosamine diphosphorylase/glucosamine-1-phosphate N-acetyltransferase
MRNLILFDTEIRDQLKPFTLTRPVSEIRLGVFTIREKWEIHLQGQASFITEEYLDRFFPIHVADDNLIINAAVLPTPELVLVIKELAVNESISMNGELIAARLKRDQFDRLMKGEELDELTGFSVSEDRITLLDSIIKILDLNEEEIKNDLKVSQKVLKAYHEIEGVKINGPYPVYIQGEANLRGSSFNTEAGPIFIGRSANIMEGASIVGPAAIGEKSILKTNTCLYPGTTVGPYCNVGGEIKNSILFSHSNKSHDGYLGDSVIGEGCNIAAGTQVSNLRNTFTPPRIWDYKKGTFETCERLKVGVFMGDFSRTGINTSINSGSIIGVSSNVFGHGFAPKFTPSFTWGGIQEKSTYQLEKAIIDLSHFFSIVHKPWESWREDLLAHVYQITQSERTGV